MEEKKRKKRDHGKRKTPPASNIDGIQQVSYLRLRHRDHHSPHQFSLTCPGSNRYVNKARINDLVPSASKAATKCS